MRVTHPHALGTTNNNTTIQGGANFASVIIDGDGMALGETFQLVMHNQTNAPHFQLRNIGGTNSVTGNLLLNSGGARWDIGSESGRVRFSGAVSTYASSASITETDECWGPASCGAVPGYTVPSSTDFNAAMNTFTNNYNIMYANLAKMCSPTGNTANCITEINYAPIQQAFTTTSFAYNSPQNLVTQAAEGVYGVLQNMQAWSSQYQALITGNPGSASVSSWQASMNALNQQAQACGMAYLQFPACAPVFQSCSQTMAYNPTYVQPQCMPTAFTQNPTLSGMVNPFTLTGAEETDQTASSIETSRATSASTVNGEVTR